MTSSRHWLSKGHTADGAARQHILLWVPRFWWHSPHPFTIVNAGETSQDSDGNDCQEIHLVMRTKAGFTRQA